MSWGTHRGPTDRTYLKFISVVQYVMGCRSQTPAQDPYFFSLVSSDPWGRTIWFYKESNPEANRKGCTQTHDASPARAFKCGQMADTINGT